MPTNVKENGFESSIVSWLVQHNGYEQGSNADYNKEIAMDETRLFRFLNTTQADKMKQLRLENDPLEKEKILAAAGSKSPYQWRDRPAAQGVPL